MSIKKSVGRAVTKVGGKSLLKVKKHSPTILIGVGVVGMVSTVVLASKATLKLEDIIDDHNDKMNQLEAISLGLETFPDGTSDPADVKKDKVTVFTQTTLKVVKLYGPAITTGIVSIGCVLGGYRIIHQRNVGLMAAYKAVETSFREYRGRVRNDVGDIKDREYMTGGKAGKVKTVEVDENGKEKKVEQETILIDPADISDYARVFDKRSREWRDSPEYNMMYVRSQEKFANERLKAVGYVFLSEVFDDLGIPDCPAARITGWTFDETRPDDKQISFGIFELADENANFINGYEPDIYLDFNVEGVMYDKI